MQSPPGTPLPPVWVREIPFMKNCCCYRARATAAMLWFQILQRCSRQWSNFEQINFERWKFSFLPFIFDWIQNSGSVIAGVLYEMWNQINTFYGSISFQRTFFRPWQRKKFHVKCVTKMCRSDKKFIACWNVWIWFSDFGLISHT